MPTHPLFEDWYQDYKSTVFRVIPKFESDGSRERIAWQYGLTPTEAALTTISGEYEKLKAPKANINGREMWEGLDKIRNGIQMIRDGCDHLRIAASDTNGDTYALVEIASTMCNQMTGVMWQVYERFRQRFR